MRHRLRALSLLACFSCAAIAAACTSPDRAAQETAASDAASASARTSASTDAVNPKSPYVTLGKHLRNRVAYIPSQCFVKSDATHNTCYTCHSAPEAPNYVDDSSLQMRLLLPTPAANNPWTNVLRPPIADAPHESDDAVLGYVRTSNYFDADGTLTLARTLSNLPHEWDENGDGKWSGFIPDAYFHFDSRGFDRRTDGEMSGWRAFGYYPFPGAFFPTNGSADDVLIRLDPLLRTNEAGELDTEIYVINLAIVEALITRHDVAIEPVDEAPLKVDLDLDGRLGRASKIAFDLQPGDRGATRMHYVGQGRDPGKDHYLPIAPGLYPLGTEFLHTVRYLDLGPDGAPAMAARMKEVRYAKKLRWEDYPTARAHSLHETREEDESLDGTHEITWEREHGVYNKRGWVLQGFIETKDGDLRPQSFEESAACAGCHGGIGATVDSTFAFARKIGGPSVPARGWFHESPRDLRGLPEPKRVDDAYEYSYYLSHAGAGDELRENQEILRRFFDAAGALKPTEIAQLHRDVATLLLPSPARALDLDRAYHAIVRAQTFDQGRDTVLTPSPDVYAKVPVGADTGVTSKARETRLAAAH